MGVSATSGFLHVWNLLPLLQKYIENHSENESSTVGKRYLFYLSCRVECGRLGATEIVSGEYTMLISIVDSS